MGFLSSLFGSKTPAPRQPAAAANPQPAPATPEPAADTMPPFEPIAAVPLDTDIPSALDQARALLDQKDLPAALALYERIAATDGDLAEPFARISGDLGATDHIDAMIDFMAPRFDPAQHGLPAGINLLQGYLHQKNPVAAQELLDLLTPLVTTYSMRDRLDGFRCAILEQRASQPPVGAALPPPGAGAAPDIQLINISKPIWTYGAAGGEALLPEKSPRTRLLAIMPFALVGEGLPAGKIPPADHPLAALARGLPFALAEACWYAPAYRAVALTGLDPNKNLLVPPRVFSAGQIRDLFPRKEEPLDYAICGTIRAGTAGALAGIEFVIWNIRKNKLLKSLRLDDADALARGWPLLLGYIEAAKPSPASFDYATPADPAAHAAALDHVLHFFLVEKNVLPPEKLAPHEPRLTALADYAEATPGAAVPKFALQAALQHCTALGLAIPPAIGETAERLAL